MADTDPPPSDGAIIGPIDPASGDAVITEIIPDAPMPAALPTSISTLRRPPRIFRTLREWIQDRLVAVITALGEFLLLFAFVLSVILGSIFVLTNRIIAQQVLSSATMPGGTYAPDGTARYTAGKVGQAFAIAFVDGLPAKPIPIAASGAALPAVKPKLAEEARAENSARDALLAAAGGFQASADTKAALSAPILSGKLLSSLQAAKAGGSSGPIVVPTRGTGPQPTTVRPTQTPTVQPTNTVAVVVPPTIAATRVPGTATVAATVAPPATVAPTNSPARTATVIIPPTTTIVAVTATPVPSATALPPTATQPARTPTPLGGNATPTPLGGIPTPTPLGGIPTPTLPVIPTVTAAPPTATVPVPPSPTVAFSPTSAFSPTPPREPSPTQTLTPTLTPTQTPTPTPTRAGGPSPTALAVIDFSTLAVAPGGVVKTSFPGIFSTGADPTGAATPAPLKLGPGGEFKRTILFTNSSGKPLDFLPDVSFPDATNPLLDPVNGVQMEILINGETRYIGPLDVSKSPNPPFLERIPPNDYVALGIRMFLPPNADDAKARQAIEFSMDFNITRY